MGRIAKETVWVDLMDSMMRKNIGRFFGQKLCKNVKKMLILYGEDGIHVWILWWKMRIFLLFIANIPILSHFRNRDLINFFVPTLSIMHIFYNVRQKIPPSVTGLSGLNSGLNNCLLQTDVLHWLS